MSCWRGHGCVVGRLLMICRRFFPPAAESETKDEGEAAEMAEVQAAVDAEAAEGEELKAEEGEKTPDLGLPDVPKDAPTEHGEPQPKKAKLQDDAADGKKNE